MTPCVATLAALTVSIGLGWSTARAHELRPALLELRQQSATDYDVTWRVPARGDMRLQLGVDFPDTCAAVTPRRTSLVDSMAIEQWRARCAGGLDGATIGIAGLASTLTDVIVRITRADGGVQTTRVLPASPRFTVEVQPSPLDVARTYLTLGVEHILFGVDHLLFVLALLLLVRGGRRIVLTVTAFTVAHSLTLAAATLGLVHVPGPPVEATIALSIVFVAREIAMAARGRPGLTEARPWLVAFTFGLLHGFGFAGALAQVGLPAKAIPIALLCFNVGVEAGQLLFVGAVLALASVARHRLPRLGPGWRWIPPYAIGAVASYWVIERVVAFWS